MVKKCVLSAKTLFFREYERVLASNDITKSSSKQAALQAAGKQAAKPPLAPTTANETALDKPAMYAAIAFALNAIGQPVS
jgi:hypothetical protein